MASLSPPEVAAYGCHLMARRHVKLAHKAGSLDDISAHLERAAELEAKSKSLRNGTVKYIPILDKDLQEAYETAIRRLKP